jgi:prepilin-type N-terminal cleavage/methylation domain-containing protein
MRTRGFTLIEMAFVLVIAGLVISGALTMYKSLTINTAISTTRVREEAARTALISFISRNNRLPCPAVPTLASNDPLYGHEAATPGTCTNTTYGPIAIGILPWLDLGMPDENAQDAYSHRITYAVALAATNLTADTVTGMKGVMSVYPHKFVAGMLALNPSSPAVVVLISHGFNGYGAYLPDNGVRMAPPPGVDEQENTDADVNFVKGAYSESPTNPFDDIVLWQTPTDLLTPLARDGAIPSARSVTNDRMHAMQETLIGQTILASGVVPTILPAGLDGWNQPFGYTYTTQNVCNGGTGPAFTIVSPGPDGTAPITLSQDGQQLMTRVLAASRCPP